MTFIVVQLKVEYMGLTVIGGYIPDQEPGTWFLNKTRHKYAI